MKKMDSRIKDILQRLRVHYFNGEDKKNEYTYYNLDLSHKKFMIIIQNPGSGKKKSQERNELNATSTDEEFIRVCRKYLQLWINEKINKEFWNNFINKLKKIEPELTTENILDYFSITDIIKRRTKNRQDKLKVEGFERSILEEEIKSIAPQLIFVFGSRAWNSIRDIFKENIIPKSNCNIKKPVNKAHGHLFQLKTLNIYIIPALHFSNKVRMNCPRESYSDYLEEGINKFKSYS